MNVEQKALCRKFFEEIVSNRNLWVNQKERNACGHAILSLLGVAMKEDGTLVPVGVEIKYPFGSKPDYSSVALTWDEVVNGKGT